MGITFRGVNRYYAVDNDFVSLYRDGGRFSIVRGHEYFEIVDTTGYDRGVSFPERELIDREYFTSISFIIGANCRVSKVNDVTMSGAVTRLTCARNPTDDTHERLRTNQFLHLNVWDEFAIYRKHLCDSFSFHVEQLHKFTDVARKEWSEAPHAKRKLRMRVQESLDQDTFHDHKTWVMTKNYYIGELGNVQYKCKPGEQLKWDGYVRAVGDMTAPGAALTGWIWDDIKLAFTEPFFLYGCNCRFIKGPYREMMIEAFDSIIDAEKFTMIYFSDDCCMGFRCSDGQLWINGDISKCDASIFNPVFNFMEDLLIDLGYDRELIDRFMRQTMADCEVTAAWDERGPAPESFVLRPGYNTMYSGLGVTTSGNNVVNSAAFISIAREVHEFESVNGRMPTKAEMILLITAACEKIGFIMKVIVCEKIEHIQFLKTSPTRNSGVTQLAVNLGAMFRGWGKCKYDLPGRRSEGFLARCAQRNSDIVASWVHYGDTSILRAFQQRFLLNNTVAWKPEFHDIKIHADSHDYIDDQVLIDRYSWQGYTVTQADIDDFVDYISVGDLGEVFRSNFTDAVFAIDYGFEPNDGERPLEYLTHMSARSSPLKLVPNLN